MTGMQVNLTGSGLLKLFRQVGHLARRGSDQQLALGKLTEALGWYFGLDRCMALLVNPDSQELELVADFAREAHPPGGEALPPAPQLGVAAAPGGGQAAALEGHPPRPRRAERHARARPVR